MSDYKTTLNLPTTEFPMRANLASREPQTLAHWQQEDLYTQLLQQRSGANKFILHDGPPYANGHLHCGHALNKILKDIIVKSKHLRGYQANFVPGWDCHGLPIELNVEKKIGRAGDKVSAKEFREHCAKYAKEQMCIQAQEAQRLGVIGDFHHPYATMRYDYEASVVRALGKIIKQGHLQQGFKPVHWCVACGSALAEAEVEYEDKTSSAIDVAFSVEQPQGWVAEGLELIVPIWTTTPWTLPANEAVALHPDASYDLIQIEQQVFIVAHELVQGFVTRLGVAKHEVVASKLGRDFTNLRLHHPFLPKTVPLILGEHVTIDTGTGAVHTAPSHGPEDYIIGSQYHLPIDNLLKPNGCFRDDVPDIAGLSVWKANGVIIDILQRAGRLLAQESLVHSYPHCWRHKTPLIFMATPQWFVMMDTNGLRQQLLAEIEQVEWLPAWGKARMQAMIENRPDWCLSRQRSWGTPMTLFVHRETKALHPKTLEFIELVAQRIEQEGLEAWFGLDPQELLGEDAAYYEKVTDTLDVWFDSGVSHYAVLEQNIYQLQFPADLYLEGSDQYRGWFNSSLTTAVAMGHASPYRSVLIHGFTVDGEGKKLSKSKGNYVELNSLIQQHGADVLRLWVSSTDYRYEVAISAEILQRSSDAYRRIRNTARFLLSNLFDYDHLEHAVKPEEMLELDAYILAKTEMIQQEIIEAYDTYQFHSVYQKLLHFCAIDLGSFYLDIIKDRQYTMAKDAKARRSCQTAMYHILHAMTLWMAPILSFTAEEIWQYIPNRLDHSVFLTQWYQDFPAVKWVNLSTWAKLERLRDEVNKATELKRQDGLIGSGLASGLRLYLHSHEHDWLHDYALELKFLFICSKCELCPPDAVKPQDCYLAPELGIGIEVYAVTEEKCERCWHRDASVATDSNHPSLCQRCVNNISGRDEQRLKI